MRVTHFLPVSEVFGPTVQGEGPYAGRTCLFVRLGGCNLTCGPCDTPYTWDAARFNLREQIRPTPAPLVLARLVELTGAPPAMVVLSGGEPLLHQHSPAFRELVTTITARWDALLQIETNGTLPPLDWLVLAAKFVVSPKLSGPMATNAEHRRIVPAALGRFAALARSRRAHFKIVCGGVGDVATAARFADGWNIPRHRVWIMPEATDPGAVVPAARRLVGPATAAGMNLTLRNHMLLWPTEDRGR